MILSDQDVKEFQDLHKTTFREELTYEVAYEQAMKLLRLMADIYKPMTVDEFDFFTKEREERHRAFLASQSKKVAV